MSTLYGYSDLISEDVETIDSDEEDEKRSSRDPDKSPFSIIWRDDLKNDNIKISCSSLLITLGTTASAFAFTHVLCNYDLELIGYGTDEKMTDDGNVETKSFDQIKTQQYSTQSVDRIYRLPSSSFVLIQLNSSIKSDRLWPISEQILNKFNFSNLNISNPIYIIQSHSSMDYVTITGELENKSNLFIRYIKSSIIPTDDKITQTIKPIEPPNAIRGLSAALFTKFHQANIPVIVLVVYQRHSSVNADALKLLQRILDRTSPTLKPYIQLTEKTNKQLIRLASTQTSNMYS
ncbi:unnamed protein product [Rotaria sp. Silwood1]|nr:unnamed protein product [Rotaria sp. Silwood1]CAF3364335.1 unnamed protein product [Rotaria sp. Silwood1]CAF3378996.1 unnamed protein product [Rotaria sp. Silwood1]CAF4511751.1 unnamed protein product [Rotaria sp. Silwood1]CAF4567243.1 unnamed protein product [Rotaria sp. Silwood1]